MNGRLGFGVGTIGAFLWFLVSGLLAVLLVPFAAGGSTAASATTITVNITAEVALVVDWDEMLGGAINVGDTITGTYTYDSATSDSNPLPTVGDYWHSSPPNGITVNAGGFVFETDPSNVSFVVEIVNDHGSPPMDNHLLRSYNNLPLSNGALVDEIAWQLDDASATALSSDALPAVPPTLGDWESTWGLTLMGSDPDPWGFDHFAVRAHVTSANLATPPTPPPAVGGIVELLSAPSGSPQRQAPDSAPSAPPHVALAALAAAALVALTAGAWYARRRWLG